MANPARGARRSHPSWMQALSFAILFVGLLGVAGNAAVPSLTVRQINLSSQALTRFTSSHSLNDLSSAIAALDGAYDIYTLIPNNFTATRRGLVQGWAVVLKAIERSYDPSFNPKDPNNLQWLCVPQPVINGRIVGPGTDSCMSPNDIKDPKIRAAYIASINENNVEIRRWSHYLDISRLDAHAMSSLEVTLRVFRTVAPDGATPDFAALDAILRQAGLGDARRTKIDAMFYARPGP